MAKRKREIDIPTCDICQGPLVLPEDKGWTRGHAAWPVSDGRCCRTCNANLVLPARIRAVMAARKDD
jgi:hypothetical protein